MEKKTKLDSLILNSIIDGILLYKVSNEKIVYTNPQFERLLVYDPGELIGQHVSILNAPNEKSASERTKDIRKALIKVTHGMARSRNIKKDGSTFWSHASIFHFYTPGIRRGLGVSSAGYYTTKEGAAGFDAHEHT